MRIAREVIETLKMELGLIKYTNIELKIPSRGKDLPMIIKANFGGFCFTCPKVLEITFSQNHLPVNSLLVNKMNLSIINLTSNDFYQKVLSVELEKAPPFLEEKFEGYTSYNSSELIEKVTLLIDSSRILLNNPTIERVPTLSNSALTKNFTFAFKMVKYESNVLSQVNYSVYNPAQYVERENILNALSKLKERYEISKIKFFAYYVNVPLQIAQMVKITHGRKLIVQFGPRNFSDQKFKDVQLKNLLVLRYEDKYLYYPF
ncbi:MAG: hypothetical protein ACP5KD_07120 [Fervidobacterium sp.]